MSEDIAELAVPEVLFCATDDCDKFLELSLNAVEEIDADELFFATASFPSPLLLLVLFANKTFHS